MNKCIISLVLSLMISFEVDGRSWRNNYSEGGSYQERGVTFENSDANPEVKVQHRETRQVGHKQLQNWSPDRIWFPDFDKKHFFSGTTSSVPPEEDRQVISKNRNVCINQCPRTSEYNPVCGTDRVTYSNVGKLECARSCGVDVLLFRKLPCSLVFQEPSTTQATETLEDKQRRCIKSCPTTPEYNPICGTNSVTYQNIGSLECAKFCGVVVDVRRLSPCPRPMRTSSVSPDGQNLFDSNQTQRAASNSFTSSTAAPDKPDALVPLDVFNEISNSPDADSIEYDIDIRVRE